MKRNIKIKFFTYTSIFSMVMSLSMLSACGNDGASSSESTAQTLQQPSTPTPERRQPQQPQTPTNRGLQTCKPLSQRQHSMIINPYHLTFSQTWKTVDLNSTRLLNGLTCFGVKRIFIQMRRADDENARDPSFVAGALYYDSVLAYSKPFITQAIDAKGALIQTETADWQLFSRNQNNAAFQYFAIENFMAKAKSLGFEVWAWLPVFNDPIMWSQAPSARLEPYSKNANEKMLSPANPSVQSAELNRLLEIANRFPIDGIAVDWFRYTDDTQPIDAAAQSEFRNFLRKQGITSPPNDAAQARDQYKTYFKTFRENILSDFLGDIRRNLPQNIRLAAFLLPHSAKKPSSNPWMGAGIDLKKIIDTYPSIEIMPMIYWINDWSQGYQDWKDYSTDIIQRLSEWRKPNNNTITPILSISTSSQYALNTIAQYNEQMLNSGLTFYYSGNWLTDGASQVEPGNLDSALQRMCEATIRSPYAVSDCHQWPLIQPRNE